MRKIKFLNGLVFIAALTLQACAGHPTSKTDVKEVKNMNAVFYTFRLKPGQDLKKSIDAFVIEKNIRAGSIVTVVGSVTQAALRYANQSKTTIVKKDLEIVSFTGTVTVNGSHLHMSVSGPKGEMVGGHLMEGSLVRTTAEITLVEFKDVEFQRVIDPQTTYDELVVREKI